MGETFIHCLYGGIISYIIMVHCIQSTDHCFRFGEIVHIREYCLHSNIFHISKIYLHISIVFTGENCSLGHFSYYMVCFSLDVAIDLYPGFLLTFVLIYFLSLLWLVCTGSAVYFFNNEVCYWPIVFCCSFTSVYTDFFILFNILLIPFSTVACGFKGIG